MLTTSRRLARTMRSRASLSPRSMRYASVFSSSAFSSGVSLISRRYVSSGDWTESLRSRRGRVMGSFPTRIGDQPSVVKLTTGFGGCQKRGGGACSAVHQGADGFAVRPPSREGYRLAAGARWSRGGKGGGTGGAGERRSLTRSHDRHKTKPLAA